MFETIGRERIGFDDFRSNGLLLPSSDSAAVRIGLPLHRGPHRAYNAMVIERVGQIEAGWSTTRLKAPELALGDALMRLELLQRALRRRLLDADRPHLSLNRLDPKGRQVDFSELDAMADALWQGTEPALAPLFAHWDQAASGGSQPDSASSADESGLVATGQSEPAS